ncbi:protein unc-13 homolog D-like isoform X2 [Bolinopsis microptera]|uniref:protein unc-13 homolog D-like isoform X2 n=1 Tax=Bolinopsis microptera TaxID=2820187 RepID=UPI0030795C03
MSRSVSTGQVMSSSVLTSQSDLAPDNIQDLPSITLNRKQAVKRRRWSAANSITETSLQKIHDESERRLSNLTNDNFEKLRRATVRLNKKEEDNLNGLVLEKLRQNSFSVKKVDVVSATRSIATRFQSVCEPDLLIAGLNAIINRLGRSSNHFETRDLIEYVRLVFKKSQFETDKLIHVLRERNESAHSLQILLERANLKRAPKSSAFCSMTLKKQYEPVHFFLCNESNTVLSTLCGSQSPLWDVTLSLPLETTKGYSLILAVWETKTQATMEVVNEGKKCMGRVEIDLNSQIATGEHQWWELSSARKPNRKKMKGKVNMGLRYNADIGRHSNAVMVYAGMLSKFLSVDYPKSGSLSSTAGCVLDLQRTQQKLSEEEYQFADWLVQSELYIKTNNHFEKLYKKLHLLLECVDTPQCSLSEQDLTLLWKTFTDVQTKYIEKMQNLNAEYPYDLESAVLNVKFFTKCYLAISQCDMYSVIHMPVIKQANLELEEAFKKNSTLWIESITSPFKCDTNGNYREMVTKLKDMTNAARLELRNESKTYGPALEGTPYSSVLLYQINEKISNVTINVLAKVIGFLRAARPESETEVQEEDLLNDCLGLYVAVADLKKLCKDMDPDSNHALDNFHSWFYSVVDTWLHMVQVKHHTRVTKCVDFDPLDRLDMHVPYSSCVVDVATMNNYLCEIKDIFDFPDDQSRYAVISKLSKQVFESALQLSELLVEKGKAMIDRGLKKSSNDKLEQDEILKKSLAVTCSLRENRNFIGTLPEVLGWDSFSSTTVHHQKLSSKLDEWMKIVCESLIEPKFVEAFEKFIKQAYRRDSTASDTLVNMLLEELTKIHSNVEPSLFEDMLTIIWERIILPQFERHVAKRPTKIKNYYDILQDSFKEVSEFFVSEMSTLDHVITQSLRYNKLIYILQNLTISLDDLLFRYFLEESIQESKQHSELGFITFTAFLTKQKDKTIVKVTVVRCSGLPIMDTLGKCDTVVKVTIQPRQTSHFSHLKIQSTKPVFNDLDPVFNQEFEFSFFTDVNELEEGACIQFTIWDKDRLSADDFIGETLCDLNSVPFNKPEEFKTHIALPDLKSLSYDVIEHRCPYEKTAEKFIKERSLLINEAGEEFISKRASALTIFQDLKERIRTYSLTD